MKSKTPLFYLWSFIFCLLLSPVPLALSQIPQGFNYQAIARDGSGNILPNTPLQAMMYVQSLSTGGTIFWKELHSTITTNSFGLFTLVVGTGTRQTESTVATFDLIDWSVTPKYLKTEIFYTGSWKDMGTSQLMSVPYALRSKESDQWISSAGNIYHPSTSVGIGTASPANLLDVLGGINAAGVVNYNSANRLGLGIIGDGTPNGLPKNDEGAYVGWMHSGLGHSAGTLALISRSFPQNCDISFYTGNVDPVERMTIKYNGNVGIGTVNPSSQLTVQPPVSWDDNTPLFEIKNKDGQTVFAVYNEGVRVYVSDEAKGVKSGFAVGGFGTDKAESQKYLVVSKDSVRIYLDTNPATKKLKGGFAVGGYDMTKGTIQDFLDVNPDSIRIYIDTDPTSKKLKGGFAVGGYDMTKGTTTDFLNVTADATGIITPSQNRILWYPIKNAFLTGKVLIENSANVGENSFASGYESKAKGDWSQALGFKAIANGNYSSAIGKNAVANSINSFAFGDGAQASNLDSYAFGAGAVASGSGSYAIGSFGRDTVTFAQTTSATLANGDYAFAIGLGAISSGKASTAIGNLSQALGDKSIALGASKAEGVKSMAFGESYAWGLGSFAAGTGSAAIGDYSIAIGKNVGIIPNYAYGLNSIALGTSIVGGNYGVGIGWTKIDANEAYGMGHYLEVDAFGSVVVGRCNLISGNTTNWIPTDPIFVIGNGESTSARSNAMTVLKNGSVGIGTVTPQSALDVRGPITGNNSFTEPGNAGTNDVAGDKLVLYESVTWRASVGMSSVGPYLQGTGGNASDNGIRFFTGVSTATERMRITRDGNVGIGTVTPNYTLDVRGTIGNNTTLYHSDIRWKIDVKSIKYGIDAIERLNGVSYSWNTSDFQDMGFEEGIQFGFIAQDFEKVIPDLVKTDKEGYKSIDYVKLTPVLVEAIKEQQHQIESQQKEIDDLKALVNSLIENQTAFVNK